MLTGLTEFATVVRDQRRLTPAAAVRWLQARHAGPGELTPLAVWVECHADRVIDAARDTREA